jgi:hypothetical protein
VYFGHGQPGIRASGSGLELCAGHMDWCSSGFGVLHGPSIYSLSALVFC